MAVVRLEWAETKLHSGALECTTKRIEMNESVEKILGEVHEGVARIAWYRVVRDRKKRSVIRHRTRNKS